AGEVDGDTRAHVAARPVEAAGDVERARPGQAAVGQRHVDSSDGVGGSDAHLHGATVDAGYARPGAAAAVPDRQRAALANRHGAGVVEAGVAETPELTTAPALTWKAPRLAAQAPAQGWGTAAREAPFCPLKGGSRVAGRLFAKPSPDILESTGREGAGALHPPVSMD